MEVIIKDIILRDIDRRIKSRKSGMAKQGYNASGMAMAKSIDELREAITNEWAIDFIVSQKDDLELIRDIDNGEYYSFLNTQTGEEFTVFSRSCYTSGSETRIFCSQGVVSCGHTTSSSMKIDYLYKYLKNKKERSKEDGSNKKS